MALDRLQARWKHPQPRRASRRSSLFRDGSVNELSSQFWLDRGKQVKRARRSPDVHDRERCRVDNPLGYRFRHDRE